MPAEVASSSMALIVALSLLVLLVAIGVGFAWQERRRIPDPARIYGVEDSIEFVRSGLDAADRSELNRHDIRRILEWSVRYLQDPRVRTDPDAPIEFGGPDMGRYIQEGAMTQGHAYEGDTIWQVLDLQAQYLGSIGALGDVADE
jgi:hypothetical protein